MDRLTPSSRCQRFRWGYSAGVSCVVHLAVPLVLALLYTVEIERVFQAPVEIESSLVEMPVIVEAPPLDVEMPGNDKQATDFPSTPSFASDSYSIDGATEGFDLSGVLPPVQFHDIASPENIAGIPSGATPLGSFGVEPFLRDGPRTSFLGSVAYGDRFVFILDASGSMGEGTRYRRACEELMKTIDDLDSQEFSVILFSDRTRVMFDSSRDDFKLVKADDEVKDRLRYWLGSITPISWSDPREAMRLALEQSPSAIFLLSDGEFKTGPKIRRLGSEAISVLRKQKRVATVIPFHTVAFEDAENRQVLRSMAVQTGGSYRYVPPLGGKGIPADDFVTTQ